MLDPRKTRLPIGDIELAVLEWPGTGDPILLLHATGFHSRCWQQVVKHLPDRHIFAVDLRFHGESGDAGPVSWQVMAGDILALIRLLDLNALVGVGHSIGGYLIARAAATEPQRFKHLVMIDPVILPPERYADFDGMRDDGAQAHPVSRRRNQWRDAQEMYTRFRDRPPFNTWHDAVLRDYCDHALAAPDATGMRALACDPLNEAGIYLNQKGNDIILRALPGITTPVTLLRARPSQDGVADLNASPTWPGLAAALPRCHEVYLPGLSHLIPMQDPALVARHIRLAHAASHSDGAMVYAAAAPDHPTRSP